MIKRQMMKVLFPALLLGTLAPMWGCQGQQAKGPQAQTEAPDATQAAEDKAAPKADAQEARAGQAEDSAKPGQGMPGMPQQAGAPECVQYIEKLCKEVGDRSPTCGAGRVVAEVMPPQACKAGLENMQYTLDQIKERQKVCVTLANKLCKDLGEDTRTCKQIQEVSGQMPPDRCSEMEKHYAEVLADLQRQEEANKPLDAAKQAKIAAKDAPSFGPANAPVTIVEFSDFQCPYCSLAANVSNQIKEKYPTQVRFVFRQFPLSFHKEAHLASQAALAANKQGKFWEYHDLLFENQKALQRADLEKYAKQLGLDMGKFKAALDKKTHAAHVDGDLEMGKEVTVQGTPTMFINGERVPNPTDFNSVSQMIEEQMAKK